LAFTVTYHNLGDGYRYDGAGEDGADEPHCAYRVTTSDGTPEPYRFSHGETCAKCVALAQPDVLPAGEAPQQP